VPTPPPTRIEPFQQRALQLVEKIVVPRAVNAAAAAGRNVVEYMREFVPWPPRTHLFPIQTTARQEVEKRVTPIPVYADVPIPPA
jgi:hypothetical protein